MNDKFQPTQFTSWFELEVTKGWALYIDWHDWWIGWYRGSRHHYVCLIPCIVIRIPRQGFH